MNKRKERFKKTLSVLVAILVAYFILIYLTGMSGTVIDAETGQPIEDAVVLVEWTVTKGFGLTHTDSYCVKEKVTDKNGRFTVFGVINPFVDEPTVTIYQRGYVAWSSRWVFPESRKRTDFKWGRSVLKLEKFKNDYSHVKHMEFVADSIHAGLNDNSKRTMYSAIKWEERIASGEKDLQKKLKK